MSIVSVPPWFTKDGDRRAHFEREARAAGETRFGLAMERVRREWERLEV